MSQVACIFRQCDETIDHTPESAVAMGDVVVLGTRLVTIARRPIAAGALGALTTRGVFAVPKVAAEFGPGVSLYWDDDADPVGGTAGTGAFTTNSALGPFAGFNGSTTAASGDATADLRLCSADAPSTTPRSALGQDDLAPYPIPMAALRVWDAPQTNAVGTPANDDLGVVYNTFLTGSPTVESGDAKAANVTRKVGFQVAVPPEYVAGQTATLRLNAGMKTTVSDTTATVDVQVARQAAPTVDICATAAQSINSLTAADKDFTLTPTDLVPGDVLDVVVTVAVVDGATGTAVIGKINKMSLLLDIKG